MKLFSCAVCQHVLFFENVQCESCGRALAYLSEERVLSALEPCSGEPDSGVSLALALPNSPRVRMCANYLEHGVCNWALTEDDAAQGQTLCRSCRLNRVIPNLADPAAKQAWHKLEIAKRRVVYTLLALGLPLDEPLGFSFKEDQAGEKVYTGHSDGLITINIAEADDAFREKTRVELGEAYRTVLGHVRHELGHYYWDRLIAPDAERTAAFRELFGDERADYEQARARHYANGAAADWRDGFVSAYASMHPWEDWAESFAHYLHIVDTLETARSYGLVLRNEAIHGDALHHSPHDQFEGLIRAWFPLTIALNSLNRSMGLHDPYPFVLSERAVEKLRFVQGAVSNAVERTPMMASAEPILDRAS